MTKTCTRCGETKPIDEFFAVKYGRDKRRNICKQCDNARMNENRHRRKEAEKAALAERLSARHGVSERWAWLYTPWSKP